MSKILDVLKWPVLGASFALMVGCASDGSVEAMAKEAKAAAAAAQESADAAQDTADEADAKATEALIIAKEANTKAGKAGGMAKSADFRATRNSKKIDRMFKKAMYK